MRKWLDRLLPVGRRSLLWGVHQFLWHPWVVYRAWRQLYGRRPAWREAVCILVHDWCYWRSPNMDGEEGERHPEYGARLAGWLFGPEYHDLVLYHSRHYARRHGAAPSPLCWADKLSILFDPPWFYLLRARLAGELQEYRQQAARAGFVPLSATDREWFEALRAHLTRLAVSQGGQGGSGDGCNGPGCEPGTPGPTPATVRLR